MAIEVKGAEVIIKAVKERLEKMRQKLPKILADEAARIVTRTQSGVDVDGKKFAEYTPAYNRRKASLKSGFITRTGRKGKKEKQVKGDFSALKQTPDLTLEGAMLDAIDTEVREEGGNTVGVIYFNSTLEANKAHGNMKKRRFFGLSEEQVERIKRRLTED